MLATPPPYLLAPWMGAGIPLLAAILERDGITPRVVKLLDDPGATPIDLIDACELTQWVARPIDDRISTFRPIADRHRSFFDGMLAILLAGPERVFGFSTYRHNSDVVIELARRLKELRPDCYVMVGGPEAAECPENLACEWIDLIVGAGAEGLISTAVRACLAGRPEELAAWQGTWVNPRHRPRTHLSKRAIEIPSIPQIDYSRILPLFSSESVPVVPVLLNVGCPFHCGFCTNTTVYPKMAWGAPHRLADEMNQIVTEWERLSDTPLRLAFCDATVNAQPAQFEEVCASLVAMPWKSRPALEGLFLVDGRITPEHARLFSRAGFSQLYFGLETASHRVRRAMKKPSPIASVKEGLKNIRDHAAGRVQVNYGIIAGWPSETEEDFHETIAFTEWATTLGIVSGVNVLPLVRTPGAMDRELFADAEGTGLVWRMDAPAGTPAVRCRRYLSVFEHFKGSLKVESGLSRRLAVTQMIPDSPSTVYEAWHRLHGDANDFRKDAPSVTGNDELRAARMDRRPEARQGPAAIKRLLAPSLTPGGTIGGWTLRSIESSVEDAVVLTFSTQDDRFMIVEVRPRTDSRPAYRRTDLFNLSYYQEYEKRPCTFDHAVLDELIATIIREEQSQASLNREVPDGDSSTMRSGDQEKIRSS